MKYLGIVLVHLLTVIYWPAPGDSEPQLAAAESGFGEPGRASDVEEPQS